MENIKDFIDSVMQMQVLSSIIVVVISFIIYECISHFLTKKEKSSNLKMFKTKKGKTYYRLIKSLIRYVFILVTILILLQVNGINVSSMLAGVGIVSVIIGFAIQDALKDIVKGFDIVADSYYNVGDVIRYKDYEGKVILIGVKTTKIEELKTSNIISISNRNIEQVEIVSNYVYVDIPMPYDVPLKNAEKIVDEIVKLNKSTELIEDCEYKGVNNLTDSSINYQVKITCNPTQRLQARRNVLRNILTVYEKNNIQVPYNQLDVHQK